MIGYQAINMPPPKQGYAEFALNLNYFNRFLSGWEPLIEPWLARVNWKLKPTKNVLTITSMDVLNINVTNTFVQLISDVMNKWKADNLLRAREHAMEKPKHQKVFQPYKVINLTGQQLKFLPYQYNDVTSSLMSVSNYKLASSSSNPQQSGNDSHCDQPASTSRLELDTDWIAVNDKCEKQFSFLTFNSKKGLETYFLLAKKVLRN